MSVILFVGPSNIGKTYTMREWLIPALLTAPETATTMAPAAGFTAALIADPPTTEHPEGQYPGPWYDDVAEWRRAERRARVARFRNASVNALCEIGMSTGGLVLCLDDMERDLGPHTRLSPAALEIITRGRLNGCKIVGAARRMKGVHTDARGNVETVYFGNLTDEDDRNYAAKTAGVSPDWLRALGDDKRPGLLLEWRRTSGARSVIRVEGRRRLILRTL